MRRVCTVLALQAAALAGHVLAAPAPPPEYKLGDVAQADFVTPVALVVMNPDATEVLKQKVSQQVHLVVRHTPQALGEAENALRASIAAARQNFLTSIRQADLEAASFGRVIGEISGRSPPDFPFEKLAPFWVRGESGDAVVESMLRPVRDFMARPIIANESEILLPPGQPLRLVRVRSLRETPSLGEVETAGETLPAGRILVLWRVQRLIETQFPAGDHEVGRFAASFVRVNAVLDPDATAAWRARELAGVTVNDTYDAAQVVVRKGQVIDRKALSALAAMREKSLIGTLQVKLEQEQSVARLIRTQTMWIAAALGAVGLALVAILFRLRARPRHALVPISIGRPERESGDAKLLGAGVDGSWASGAVGAGTESAPAGAGDPAGSSNASHGRPAPPSGERPDLPSTRPATETEVRTIGEQPDERWRERIAACEKRIAELENDLAVKGDASGEASAPKANGAPAAAPSERERSGASIN